MSNDFYLGRPYDLASHTAAAQPLVYDSADLTTHAVVTGMTGSGKTGLCIALMEEAALRGIPALMIDPKGDLTNLLLHFPELAPQDFQPWLDADSVRRTGKSLEQAAADTAAQWKQGLKDWNIAPERIRALQNAAHFSIFTPGSDAGLPISVMASLAAPAVPWEANREILREKISSTVTALLVLVGIEDVDPVRSREHILLSNIFESAWSNGKNLDLTELILQTQNPPFEKLGAFPVNTFFPEKDRGALAVALNNILASPAFESWREGQPLDIPALLYAPDGRPRHTIFYVAHLSDSERMFFVTLLLSAFETWMRTQAGSASLRALVYFDELFGYLPPQSNPPSKLPLLRMLKQARAFGVGLVLATQNPMDVDYKGLSNAGTWFIGKLQTERDKDRLLEGLESATGAGLDREAYSKMISALSQRIFLMHNVHANQPILFQTRWTMNFLAGPLTRAQIPALNRLAGGAVPDAPPQRSGGPLPAAGADDSLPAASPVRAQPVAAAAPLIAATKRPSSATEGTQSKPAAPPGVAEYFLPMNYGLTEAFKAAGEAAPGDARMSAVLYRPALLAAASIRFLDRRYGVDSQVLQARLVDAPDKRGAVRWEDFSYHGPSLEKLDEAPAPQARYAGFEPPLSDARVMTAMQKDFVDWIYRTGSIKARANEALKVYAGPDVSPADFRTACSDAARAARDAELAKVTAQLDKKIAQLQEKLNREERELKQDESQLTQRKIEEAGTLVENVTGLFGGRRASRRLSSSLTKRRLTEQAKGNVDESVESIGDYQKQLKDLEAAREQATREINGRWGDVVNDVTEITLNPKKTDIFLQQFGVAWMPFYLIEGGGEAYELPAFGPE